MAALRIEQKRAHRLENRETRQRNVCQGNKGGKMVFIPLTVIPLTILGAPYRPAYGERMRK